MRAPDRVVILNDISTGQGGASYLATSLARGLREHGAAVTFVAGDEGSDALGPGIEVVALGGAPLIEGGRRAALSGLYDASVRRRVAAWIARTDTPGTAYHLHNWAGILSPAVFDALAPVGHRCVVHAHDFFLACPNGAFLDYPRASACQRRPLSAGCLATQCDKRAYAHKLWRAARHGVLRSRLGPLLDRARVVMIHEAMRPWLNRAVRPRHLLTIPNPVEPFGPAVPAPEANVRLVHVGAIQRLKGVYELAEAGRRLGLRVDFFGDGEALADLGPRYPEHAWHGWTSRAEIGRALRSARAVVVATQSPEPFCLAAFEAVATGLPLVVSDSILPAAELAGTGAALTFRAGDAGSLGEAMSRIAGDDALVAQLAAAARARGPTLATSLPDWVSAHLRLYRDVLEQGDPSEHERPVRLRAVGEAG